MDCAMLGSSFTLSICSVLCFREVCRCLQMCVGVGTQYQGLVECSPPLESRMRVSTVSFTMVGQSGTRQRPVRGHR